MSETFTPKDWQTGPGGGTPISESELDRIETGIESMDDTRPMRLGSRRLERGCGNPSCGNVGQRNR